MIDDGAAQSWQRLSRWSVVHFAMRGVIQSLSGFIFYAPATMGVAASRFSEYAWLIPGAIISLIVFGSVIEYVFTRYRLLDDAVQLQRGALFKKRLNLKFARVQNISIEHPFYFRPLQLANVKIDGAGSAKEEISLAALQLGDAEHVRKFIIAQRESLSDRSPFDGEPEEPGFETTAAAQAETVFFTRSLRDLIIHGLTNNRAFIIIGGIFAFAAQSNFSYTDAMQWLGIDFDVVVAGWSVMRMVVVVVASFVLAIGLIAFFSVLVSVFSYYGFELSRTSQRFIVRRGLLTKHEVQVQKSRVQTVTMKQDWLDYLLGRHNIIFEQISHRAAGAEQWSGSDKRILIPSVKLSETPQLTDQVWPIGRLENVPFTPISKRYFVKYARIFSAAYIAVGCAVYFALDQFTLALPILCVIWLLHIALLFMRWKRAGIAIVDTMLVARSGTVGIDYRVFPAFKVQDASHIQSILMKRRGVSTVLFHTAATSIRVPYLHSGFAKRLIDLTVYRVESTARSWM